MKAIWIVPVLFVFVAEVPQAATTLEGPFLAKPYLQFGPVEDPGSLAVLWQVAGTDNGEWSFEWKREAAGAAFEAVKPAARTIPFGVRHVVYVAVIKGLKPGEKFEYRVLQGGKPAFTSEAHAPLAAGAEANYKFAVFGDCGADSAPQKEIAVEAYQFKPDFVFIPGDIVYWTGTASEYHTKFFPIYNADKADRKFGAPLMRSTLFLGSVGNHDVAGRDLGSHADGLAYFYYWMFPLNGYAPFVLPGFKAAEGTIAALTAASGGAFPRMTNYSFDYGNSHWLVLDSNADVDWTQKDLAGWVAEDLQSPAAKKATWRFVGFHHPGFSSSHMHAGDQQMRVLSKVFEDANVDVVFSGHVHNYQRSAPLHFQLKSYNPAKNHLAPGEFTIDRVFDGKTHTKPSGVIYLVSGAGGAFLYDKGQGKDRKSWKEFTVEFVSDIHSFTAVEVEGGKAKFRQVDEQGREVDSFVVTK